MASFYERLKIALFGGPASDDYLNDANLFYQVPTLTVHSVSGETSTVTPNKSQFATPKAAEAVAALFGGSVAAPDISGSLPTTTLSVASTGENYKLPSRQQVNIPGMVGTQNAGDLIATINKAAAEQKRQPVSYDASKLANNVGDNPDPRESGYFIGSLQVPYSVWLSAQPAITSGEGIKVA